ncbi:MAG: GH116 family glycosyl-hydrolase [Paludibacter sp.]
MKNTNKFNVLLLLFIDVLFAYGQWKPQSWPVIKHYDGAHLQEIALPMGGIGTGTVSLGGRGELRDWEIMNVPAKGFSTVTTGNNAPFFAIYVKEKDKKPQSKALLGSLYDNEYLHYEGRPVDHHGLPRFETASFDAAYPFGQVNLEDKSLLIKVKIKGFNPLIPTDADNSGLPIAILTYEVSNTSDNPIEVAVCGSIRNFIGKDGQQNTSDWKGDVIPTGAKKNRNTYKIADNFRGIYFDSQGVDSTSAAWGTMALTTQESVGVTYRTASKKDSWSNSMLSFWDDFSADGELKEKYKQDEDDPMASLSVKKTIAAHSTASFPFFITWNFPNRYEWTNKNLTGNYHSHQFKNAWNVAEKVLPRLSQLESKTLDFVNAISQSSYPDVVKEAALFNLAVLRSQTVFRLPSGHLMGWEGVMDKKGSCEGSCTHVWNYEVATPFLFGELAKTMRDVEFNYATKENGLMNFRADLPLSIANKKSNAAADGQMGCIMKFYRDWQLSGDNDFMKKNYTQVKKVLAFAWTEKGWDANQDGVMEGSQHNTMDVNYFGPNPQMGFWYMGALRAAEEMAIALKDKVFAEKCKLLFTKGSQWMDANLFNGKYYEQKITDPKTFEYLDMANPTTKVPPFQLGSGCLVDQLVGQYMAHICGLGYLGNKANIQTASKSVMTNNFVPDFSNHFNNMRSYAMGNEAGLLMASWPKGRLEVPFPYFPEVMTGFEYAAAVEMIYEGQKDDALKCIQAIRDRHNGAKRNPFSEPECGHHYARSMASWATIIAMSEFSYSGVEHSMTITSKPGTYFWSNGYAWGTCTVSKEIASIKVLKGSLMLNTFSLKDNLKPTKVKLTLNEGDEKTIKIVQ